MLPPMRLLGTITVPAASSRNNTDTAVPFVIPLTVRALRLRTADADLGFELRPDATSPSTFATTAAAGYPLAANVAENVRTGRPGAPIVLAVFNAGGAPEAVKVWGVQVE